MGDGWRRGEDRMSFPLRSMWWGSKKIQPKVDSLAHHLFGLTHQGTGTPTSC
jgi:hypothetical protein